MVTIKGNLINLSRLLIAATASAAAVLLSALPANAATGPTTPITLTITGGALQINAPSAAVPLNALANAAGTTTVSAPLGLVTVTDARSASPASWNASASSSDFTAPAVGSPGVIPLAIPASAISYTVFTGSGAAPGGLLTQTEGQPETLSTGSPSTTPAVTYSANMSNAGQIYVSASAGIGDNVVTWNPTIVVTIPSTAVAGASYAATVTHSVL